MCDVEERSDDPSVAQALHVINGETLNGKLRAEGNSVDAFLKLGLSDRRILEHVYLSAFSRFPTESEEQTLLGELREARNERGSGASPGACQTRVDRRFDVGAADHEGIPVQPLGCGVADSGWGESSWG